MADELDKENPFNAIVELAKGRDNHIVLSAIKAISILSLTSLIVLFTQAQDYIKIGFALISLIILGILLGESPYKDIMKLISKKQKKLISEQEFEKEIDNIDLEKTNFRPSDDLKKNLYATLLLSLIKIEKEVRGIMGGLKYPLRSLIKIGLERNILPKNLYEDIMKLVPLRNKLVPEELSTVSERDYLKYSKIIERTNKRIKDLKELK